MLLPLKYAAIEIKWLCLNKKGFLVYDPVKARFSVIATKALFSIWPSTAFSHFSDAKRWATGCVLVLTQLIGYKVGVYADLYWIDWTLCGLGWTLSKQKNHFWNWNFESWIFSGR